VMGAVVVAEGKGCMCCARRLCLLACLHATWWMMYTHFFWYY